MAATQFVKTACHRIVIWPYGYFLRARIPILLLNMVMNTKTFFPFFDASAKTVVSLRDVEREKREKRAAATRAVINGREDRRLVDCIRP